jgi:hypothetical protein
MGAEAGKWLLTFGLALAVIGGGLLVLSRLGVNRLPGDRRGSASLRSPRGPA